MLLLISSNIVAYLSEFFFMVDPYETFVSELLSLNIISIVLLVCLAQVWQQNSIFLSLFVFLLFCLYVSFIMLWWGQLWTITDSFAPLSIYIEANK